MPVPSPVVQDYQADDRTIALTKEFKKMKPPLFKEGIDPLKVETWVLGIKKLFEVFPCTEGQKVLLAAFTLEDESIQDRKVSEFENLKQGNKTITEYDVQFTELTRFTPYMVDMNYKKAKRFKGGLQDSILEKINILQVQKYVDVLDRAIIAEGNQANRNRYSDWKGKR
ncbi:uncharacterized protein LOC114304399 [Camellia sinensis]|uniref:uncharacterized protein LOC114304399 n=1 Tax=Camellia sinensis TaxID=4442 RepID=UPI001035CA41|nr:uncharacterized protein LOC114304399 [Camellia sinensis]